MDINYVTYGMGPCKTSQYFFKLHHFKNQLHHYKGHSISASLGSCSFRQRFQLWTSGFGELHEFIPYQIKHMCNQNPKATWIPGINCFGVPRK